MIIPSIDLIAGRTVQLVGGRDQTLDAGDPFPWLERFALAGEVAVVDLDAARGTGNNRELIARLCATSPCRVGGGIRDLESARFWLDAGAARIVIGTAAEREFLGALPRDRVVVALDAINGEVVIDGWRTRTGHRVLDRIVELHDLVGAFLVTFVEREGRLGGTDLAFASDIIAAAGSARVTVAGGVTAADEIAQLDRMGADAQVGMALYTDRLLLADAIAAPLTSDRADGLFPTVVADERGLALGLAWSSHESLRQAIATRRGTYHSRRRGIWTKGETSGATQELLRVSLDCDRDAVRFTVRQHGAGFCHRAQATCWDNGSPLDALARTVQERLTAPADNSYTNRLLADPAFLEAKLVEEAVELAQAGTVDEVIREAADLWYFAMVRLVQAGGRIADVEHELGRRALRVSRRPGVAKAWRTSTPGGTK